MIGKFLLRLLYRFEFSGVYESAVAALHAVDACGRGGVVVDVGGGAGGLGRALAGVGCSLGYYVVVDIDPALASMAPADAYVERVVASACYLPLRPTPFSIVVFNDSLHHMEEPFKALAEASRVDSRCIVVSDFDPSMRPGRLLALLERLLGFPARFLPRTVVEGVLESEGYSMVYSSTGRMASYTLAACRRRQEVD